MNKWNIQSSIIVEDRIIKYCIFEDQRKLSRGEVIDYWINSKAFRQYYNSILVECQFEAFYWENPSTTVEQLNDHYEFAIIKGNSLKNVKPDPATFSQYYKEERIVVFPNLNKDAMLIVPAPLSDVDNYTHIGQFVRNAPLDQIDEFWKTVGETYKQAIGKEKRWLSTAGLGISWLHLRVDSRPKYYKYAPYKT